MKLGLVAFGWSSTSVFENLGTERLYTYLIKNNVDVEYYYLLEKNCKEDIRLIYNNVDVIGFSLYPDSLDLAKYCIKEAKKWGKVVIAGSKFATDYYETLLKELPGLDCIMLGHGEESLLYIMNQLNAGEPIGKIVKQNDFLVDREVLDGKRVCNLNINKLALPDRTKYIRDFKPTELFICDSHGCVSKCSFCSNCQNMRRYSGRSAGDLWEEIDNLYENYKINRYFFTGNSFENPGVIGKERIREFCRLRKERKNAYSFGCYISGNFIKNEDDKQLLKDMVEAGFTYLFIGVETGNAEDVQLYNKSANLQQVDELLMYLKQLKDALYTAYGFIMINPFSTMNRIKQNIEFLRNNECSVFDSYISRLVVFEKTQIHQICIEENLLHTSYSYLSLDDYAIKDKDVEVIDRFIKKNLMPIRAKLPNIQDVCRNNYAIRHICGMKTNELFNAELQKIHEVLNWYFNILYIEFDLSKSKNLLEEFRKEMEFIYKKISLININIYKQNFLKRAK